MSSETVASPSARRWTIRSRLTSASALWTRRIERSSSGWSTTAAMVERMWAGDGAKSSSPKPCVVGASRRFCPCVDRLGSPSSGPEGSTAVYINMH